MLGLRNINKYFGISTLILVYFGVIYALSEEEGEGIVLLLKNLIYFRDHTSKRSQQSTNTDQKPFEQCFHLQIVPRL